MSAVVFDLGGVLVDWDPRHLYRKLFAGDEPAMEHFLTHVCTPEWNEELDAGRPFAEATAALQRRFPEHAELIAAFWERWDEMCPGPVAGGPHLLHEVKAEGLPVYALSNWSAETWPRVQHRFAFLSAFDGIVISGAVGVKKPDAAIYRHLIEAYALEPAATLFIDDSARNVEGARRVGLQAIRFESPRQLRRELVARAVL
ncbi:MAG: HAD family hydrolase [Myxococcota bacterium]